MCSELPGGYKCECNPGFRLADDGRSCDNLDECQSDNGGCSQRCRDTLGSFICSCLEGYTLSIDTRTCLDINECKNRNGGCSDLCVNEVRKIPPLLTYI